MKFFIYNPEPIRNCSNPACNRFHAKSQDPSHIFDCYKKAERCPINFECNDRIHKLAEPHPRRLNKKYAKDFWLSSRNTYISKKFNVSSRLNHLAAPIFRRVYTTRQNVESQRSVNDGVKQNLNLHIQRSMYNIYSRLQNVKFPNIMDSRRIPMLKSIKSSGEDYEKQIKSIERLSQPRAIPQPQTLDNTNEQKRPVKMEVIRRLSIPRKIQSPEQINYTFPSRPLQSDEYYEKLSQPRKILEEPNSRNTEPKLISMKRTTEMAVPLSRLQRRKFMKGDNINYFPVSRAALQYKASAKINKLAAPRKIPEDSSQPSRKTKRKK